jgi:hypothetical protein
VRCFQSETLDPSTEKALLKCTEVDRAAGKRAPFRVSFQISWPDILLRFFAGGFVEAAE